MRRVHVVRRRVVIEYDFKVLASTAKEAVMLVDQLTNEEAFDSEEMDRSVVSVHATKGKKVKKGGSKTLGRPLYVSADEID
jgi:hypothetical protein